MLVDDPAWAEIRRLYIETDVPVRELAERFGLGERAVFARRKAEQWPARSARAAKPQARKREPKEGARAPASRIEPRHRALIRRLYTAIDLRLQLMEKRMRDGEVLPPAEEEREARGLNSLVRSLEKALQIDPDPEKPRAGGATDGKAGSGSDIERRRHEIAERLERLAARWKAPGGSG